jgi:hypothetical protein
MAQEYGPNIVTDGLVLCLDAADKVSYPGSGTTWYDLSGNGNNGTLSAAAIGTDVPGNMDFNGTDENVVIGDPAVLDVSTGDWTVSAWANQLDANKSSNQGIVGKYGSHPSITLMSDNGIARIFAYTTGGARSISSGDIADSNWHHVVATHDYDGDTTLYVDGSSRGTSSTSTDSLANNNSWAIGSRESNNNYFDGKIAGVHILNRALSAKEVSQNFNAQRSRFGV